MCIRKLAGPDVHVDTDHGHPNLVPLHSQWLLGLLFLSVRVSLEISTDTDRHVFDSVTLYSSHK